MTDLPVRHDNITALRSSYDLSVELVCIENDCRRRIYVVSQRNEDERE